MKEELGGGAEEIGFVVGCCGRVCSLTRRGRKVWWWPAAVVVVAVGETKWSSTVEEGGHGSVATVADGEGDAAGSLAVRTG